MPKFRIRVDLDSAREEAEHIEEWVVDAEDETEAEIEFDRLIKEKMYGGPYFYVYNPEEEI
jgi:hypothetical protein|tara:strand:- start:254 stop:436 length:183 start_codon:yes stop_codon:yes gene_type:complete